MQVTEEGGKAGVMSTTAAKKTGARMKLTFTSPAADDHNKSFINGGSEGGGDGGGGGGGGSCGEGTLEERKAAFMKDEELMREATKFITEIIEKAKLEAAKRAEQNAKSNGEANGKGDDKTKKDHTIAGWNNRARGFCNRVWNAVFPCFNNNELLAWTQPFRYRFTRP